VRTITRLLCAVALLAPAARADWNGAPDITQATAHTLNEGELEFGLIAPLQYGINDAVTASIHPIMLLIGVPSLNVRWRVTPPRQIAVALNIGAAWSFLETEDANGRPDDGTCTQDLLGFPGTAHVSATTTWEILPTLTLSGTTGLSLDFLDLHPIRYLLELSLALHWLVTPDDMLMLLGQTFLNFEETELDILHRPTGQLMYAHSFGNLSLAVGLALGHFPIKIGAFEEIAWPVYPVVDLWWRF
jgi:hypothetical protein